MVTDELIAITMIWVFVFIYSVAASVDFGSGFWSMFYLNKDKETKATNIANRYLSPSWEVTNVFVVLIVVALVSFFPRATYTLGTVLLLPGSLILILLAIRSAFLVFSHSTVKQYRKTLTIISGITGLFVPALLILVLPITQGGFISNTGGVERLLLGHLLTSASGWTYIVFAISSTLYLSSLLLADFSNVAEAAEAYKIYRRDALILGPISLVTAFLVVVAMTHDAYWIYADLLEHPYWMAASALCFLVGYGAFFWPHSRDDSLVGRPRVAVVMTVIQYMLAGTAYGIAHMPYIVYPNVTIQSGFTDPNMFHALFVSYIVGFAILTPGFIFFWRMFMKDRRYLKQH
jgi:cytochrome bd ubiquinol oxidase subunit II